MDDTNNRFSIFGFEIKRKSNEKEEAKRASFVPPTSEDGEGYTINAGGYFGSYVDMEGTSARTERDLILKYRDIAQQAECDSAIEDIVNESIVSDEESYPVSLVLDDLKQPDRIK